MFIDEVFPRDTLLFVFEQDWELFKNGRIPGAQGDAAAEQAAATAASSSSGGGPAASQPDSLPPPQENEQRWANDLVRMVTKASREKCGDLVWLSYQPVVRKGKYTARVRFGSTLVALTQPCAQNLLRLMNSQARAWGPQHIDMYLLKFCQDHRFSLDRTCYVYPPVGNYGSHESACCPKEGVRGTWWDHSFACEGTRPSEDLGNCRTKVLYSFLQDGKGQLVEKASLSEDFFTDDTYQWKSYFAGDIGRRSEAGSKRQARKKRKEMVRLSLRWEVFEEGEVCRHERKAEQTKRVAVSVSFDPLGDEVELSAASSPNGCSKRNSIFCFSLDLACSQNVFDAAS
jgi:hypothetical protein